MKILDEIGLNSFWNNLKIYIAKQSEVFRGELTYSDVVNGLGYIPAEASDLSVYKFDINNIGELTLAYPDNSPAPDVHINDTGNLIWSYVE